MTGIASQHLNSLEKFIFSMDSLNIVDVVVLSGASAGGFVCFLCLLRGFFTLVIAGALWCLLTFLGPSSVCERDVQQEPQQISQSSDEGPSSHVTDQYDCGVLTA